MHSGACRPGPFFALPAPTIPLSYTCFAPHPRSLTPRPFRISPPPPPPYPYPTSTPSTPQAQLLLDADSADEDITNALSGFVNDNIKSVSEDMTQLVAAPMEKLIGGIEGKLVAVLPASLGPIMGKATGALNGALLGAVSGMATSLVTKSVDYFAEKIVKYLVRDGANKAKFEEGMCSFFSNQANALVQTNGVMTFLFRFSQLHGAQLGSSMRSPMQIPAAACEVVFPLDDADKKKTKESDGSGRFSRMALRCQAFFMVGAASPAAGEEGEGKGSSEGEGGSEEGGDAEDTDKGAPAKSVVAALKRKKAYHEGQPPSTEASRDDSSASLLVEKGEEEEEEEEEEESTSATSTASSAAASADLFTIKDVLNGLASIYHDGIIFDNEGCEKEVCWATVTDMKHMSSCTMFCDYAGTIAGMEFPPNAMFRVKTVGDVLANIVRNAVAGQGERQTKIFDGLEKYCKGASSQGKLAGYEMQKREILISMGDPTIGRQLTAKGGGLCVANAFFSSLAIGKAFVGTIIKQ